MNVSFIILLSMLYVEATVLKLPLTQPQPTPVEKSMYGRQLQDRGSVELTNMRNQRYLCTVSLGNPAHNYTLMLDTGSSQTWVVGEECSGSTCDGSRGYKKQKYDPNESHSFENASEAVTIHYLRTQVDGYAAYDEMSLNGVSFPKQRIVVATKIPEALGSEANDGLIGFAWPYDNTSMPFIQNILSQLHKPIFTIWLNKQENDSSIGGMMTLGDYDYDNCDSNITYHPLAAFQRWNLNIEAVQIGSYTSFIKAQGVSDTGAPRIGCPSEAFDEIVKQMNGTVNEDGLVFVSCDDIDNYPSIQLTIGGINYNISSHQYIRKNHQDCLANIFKLAHNSRNVWLLGDPWIRSYCHVYDMGQARIGLSETRQKSSV